MGAISSSGLPYYSWEPADKLIAVHLYFDVIDRIIPEVMRGFTSLPRRGAEVGGVLLGRITPGARLEVTVEDVEFVPCEYLSGPSFHLSGRDTAGLEEALTRRGVDEALTVVGCFRSHTRKDLFLDDQDVGIFAKYFSSPGNVFLLIKPYATRASTAGFFFWEDGEVQRDVCYQEFPFGRRELGGGDPRVAMRVRADAAHPRHAAPLVERNQALGSADRPETGPAPEPEPKRSSLADPKANPLPPPRRAGCSIFSEPAEPVPEGPSAVSSRRWLWVPALLLVGALGGFFGLQYSKRSGTNENGGPLPLKLAVFENQTQLDVVWDRESSSVTGARSGVLTIQDGNFRRDIELTPIQLRDGRVRYSRITGDVSVRLEVTSPSGQSQTESIRLIAKDVAPPASAEGSKPVESATQPPAETAVTATAPPPAPKPDPVADPPRRESPPPVAATPAEAKPERPTTKKKAAVRAASRPKPEVAEPAPPPAPEPAEAVIDIKPGRRR